MSNPGRPHKNSIHISSCSPASSLPSPSPSSPSQGATGENDWFAISHGIECFHTEDSDPFESFGQVAPVQPPWHGPFRKKFSGPKPWATLIYPRIHFFISKATQHIIVVFLFSCFDAIDDTNLDTNGGEVVLQGSLP